MKISSENVNMEEFVLAEQKLQKLVTHQQQQLVQSTQKVVEEYLSTRKQAKQKSEVPASVLSDLNHQIYTLQQLDQSGIVTQTISKSEIHSLLAQYRSVREQILQSSNKLSQQMQEGSPHQMTHEDIEDLQSQEQFYPQSSQQPLIHRNNIKKYTIITMEIVNIIISISVCIMILKSFF